jgi:hypothetical protein
VQVFKDNGKHARAAVGVSSLPLDSAVEIEFIAEIWVRHYEWDYYYNISSTDVVRICIKISSCKRYTYILKNNWRGQHSEVRRDNWLQGQKVLGVEGREDLARQYSDREIEEYALLQQ